jgi:hypothetical protein
MMTGAPNGKIAARLHAAEGLAERVEAVAARAELLRSRLMSLPPTFDAKLLFDTEGLCGTLRDDLARITGQLEAGNGFLTGFGLWMAGRNVDRLEQMLTKAEKGAA